MLQVETLQPYFSLSSKEQVLRILKSLIPFNRKFYAEYTEKPDLYGPYWILTTLIAVLFISGNIARYVRVGKTACPVVEDAATKAIPEVDPLAAPVELAELAVPDCVSPVFLYNFTVIPIAVTIIYSVGIGFPILFKLLLNVYGIDKKNATPLVTALGLYGYSFASFVLPCLLCCIPISWLQWVLISYAAFTSIAFLITNFW